MKISIYNSAPERSLRGIVFISYVIYGKNVNRKAIVHLTTDQKYYGKIFI